MDPNEMGKLGGWSQVGNSGVEKGWEVIDGDN